MGEVYPPEYYILYLVGGKPSISKPHSAGCLVAGLPVTTCSVGVTREQAGGRGDNLMTGLRVYMSLVGCE